MCVVEDSRIRLRAQAASVDIFTKCKPTRRPRRYQESLTMSLNAFTPGSGLLGGSLIGLSAATLLLFNGDILGASGLASSFVLSTRATLTQPKNHWKLCFIAAFAATTKIYLTFVDTKALDEGLAPGVTVVSPLGFIVGGFLVGFGTRLGNGCTTGVS